MALIAPDGLNHWISHSKDSFAWWHGVFESDKFAPREQILRFARVYEAIAERTGILRPMIKDETGEFIPMKQATGLSFSEHILQYLEEFDARGKATEPPYVSFLSRVAFYDENADIVEQEVDDLGILLRKLRTDQLDRSSRYMYSNPPVDPFSRLQPYSLVETAILKQFKHHQTLPVRLLRTYVSFKLPTDIWFGKVPGWMDDRDSYDEDRWYDNLDLAERHTPRLNQFLQAMYDVFQEIEGTWEVDMSETLIRYRPLINETGITLD